MGALSVTRIDTIAGDPPRVAYSVGRSVGNAVTRNRVRRRLRAAVRHHGARLSPGSAYLVGATNRAVDATYRDIEDALGVLLERASADAGASGVER